MIWIAFDVNYKLEWVLLFDGGIYIHDGDNTHRGGGV